MFPIFPAWTRVFRFAMGRPCTICTHPERAEIEQGIAERFSCRRLAQRYDVSISALSRHLKVHVGQELLALLRERAAALEERELSASLGPELVERMHAYEVELAEILNLIEEGVGGG